MNIILLNTTLLLYAARVASQAADPNSKTLDNFKTTQASGTWMSVNDGVMGGLSQGGPKVSKQHHLVFKADFNDNAARADIDKQQPRGW